MKRGRRFLLLMVCISFIPAPLFAQNETSNFKDLKSLFKEEVITREYRFLTEDETPNTHKRESLKTSFLNFINSKAYAADIYRSKEEEKDFLRTEWKQTFGIDLFFPYFKAKEVEDWAREKTSVKVHKMTGRPKINKNRIEYIFKAKF